MSASRMSLLTRVGAAAAAAAMATTAVIATASAAGAAVLPAASTASAAVPHVAKLHTSLSIRSATDRRRHFAVIGGTLRSRLVPVRGEVVYLESRTAGRHFAVVRREITHRHGGWVAFRVSPAATTRYVLVFRGSPNFRQSHSGVVTVRAGA